MRKGLLAALCVLVVVTCPADLAQADHGSCLQINTVSLTGSHQRLACYQGPWYASAPQFSRDHRYLYYVQAGFEYPSPHMWVARVDGTSNTRLLSAPGSISGFRLSPDSGRIAFTTFADANGGEVGLWVVNSDGTGLRRLDDYPSGFAWAPDSRRLAVRRGAPAAIKIIDVETGAERALTDGGSPQWAPDGRFIAFQAGVNIGLIRAGGGARQILARGSSPQWLPDGRRLSFLRSEAPKRSSLWIVSRSGGRPRRVLSRADRRAGQWTVAWSPQGAQFAYGVINFRPRRWSAIVVASLDRRPRRLRVEANRTVESLSWSRNGRSILYVSQFTRTD